MRIKLIRAIRKPPWFKLWSAITGVALVVALLLTFLPYQVDISTDGLLSISLSPSFGQSEVEPVPPEEQPTDPEVLKALLKAGIDKNYVKLIKDHGLASDGKSPYTLTYKDLKSDTYVDLTSQLPMVNCNNTKVEVGWETKDNKNFKSKINQFIATVSETKTTISVLNDQPDGKIKKDNVLIYQPQLYLDNTEVKPISKTPYLYPVDPLNSNYQNNVLEWDYGICKRRLRLIEGKILGTWVFAQNPNGEIRIQYNQAGDFRLHLEQYEVSDDEELVPAEAFENPFDGYPFIVSDSLTFYPDPSTSVDGHIRQYYPDSEGLTWAAMRAGDGNVASSSSTVLYCMYYQADVVTNCWVDFARGITLFNTSSLPDDATISGATLSIRGSYKGDSGSFSPDVCICSSAPASSTTLEVGDFDTLGYTAFSTAITYSSFSTTGYNDFALNANGLAAISKTGVSKFGVREYSHDLLGPSPTWASYKQAYMQGYASEQGNGYKPKLVVTYNLPVVAPIVTTQAATNIYCTNFTASGNITDTGGANCTTRGFCYFQGTSGDPTTANSTAYDTGSFGTGAYSKTVGSLSCNVTYRVRAYAINSAGTGYGTTVSVTTGTPGISDTPDVYDFGILEVNTTSNTAINYFTLNNTGNCPVDITIQGTNMIGSGYTWTISGTATPGNMIFGMKAGLDDADDLFDVVVNTTANAFISDLPEATTQAWGLKIWAPTSYDDGNLKTGNVTLTAVAG